MLGHFTGSAVLVRDGSELLHPWLQGWYGELVFEASWAPRLPREPADDALSGAPKLLQLSLTEAFYLAFLVPDTSPRLSVESSCGPSSVPLSEPEAWLAFSAAQPRFAHNLAAFCVLRQAGWRVRCGLKYGADFALYAADGEFAAPATPPRLLPHHHACRPTTAPAAPPPAPPPWAAVPPLGRWTQSKARYILRSGARAGAGRPARQLAAPSRSQRDAMPALRPGPALCPGPAAGWLDP